jgi:hypothetical protein
MRPSVAYPLGNPIKSGPSDNFVKLRQSASKYKEVHQDDRFWAKFGQRFSRTHCGNKLPLVPWKGLSEISDEWETGNIYLNMKN